MQVLPQTSSRAAAARTVAATSPGVAAVLVVDSDVSTRAGVRMSLEQGGFAICGEAEDREGALEVARRERPDLCLLEIDMPGGGIAAAAEIAAELPHTRIVMLASVAREEDLFAALRAGAVGYLPKDIEPERLPSALRGVLNGEAAVPRTLVARMIEELRERESRPRIQTVAGGDAGLTDREWEVLLLLAERLSTAEIGERLNISRVTVRRHVGAVIRKLGVGSRAAAVELLDAARRSG